MSFLKKTREGAILVLTMDQPETRNALTGNTAVEEFVQACAEIQADRTLRAVIITGEGPVFCSGGNVKDMQRYSSRRSRPMPSGRNIETAFSGSPRPCTTSTSL